MSAEPKALEAVYFDSNLLRKWGWPDPSARLLELVEKATRAGVQACLVELVQQELTESWMRDLVRERRSLSGKCKEWVKRSLGLAKAIEPEPLPSADEMRTHFARATEKYTKLFRSVPTTTMPTAHFTQLAMSRGGAFVEGGKGFNDTVILVSVVEDMEANKITAALFVTGDNGFKNDGIDQVTGGFDLRIVGELDAVDTLLDELTSKRVHVYLAKRKRTLLAAVEAHRAELHEFLQRNLALTRDDLKSFDNVRKIDLLQIVDFVDAHSTPFELGPESREENRISVDVKIRVRVETASLMLEAVLTRQPPDLAPKPQDIMVSSREREVVVTVEGAADVTKQGIRAIKFSQVYAKREFRLADLVRDST